MRASAPVRGVGRAWRPLAGRRARDERGVSLVEAAFVTPLILFVIFAIVEGGNLMYSHLVVDNMVGNGARQATIAGDATDADYQILQKIKEGAGKVRQSDIERIIIYKAATRDATPPSGCMSASLNSNAGQALGCSVYGPAELDKTAGQLVCGWCPVDREAKDLIGVWIRYDYKGITGLTGTVSMVDQMILPIEVGT